jgi:hypothetical protein
VTDVACVTHLLQILSRLFIIAARLGVWTSTSFSKHRDSPTYPMNLVYRATHSDFLTLSAVKCLPRGLKPQTEARMCDYATQEVFKLSVE